MCVPLFQSGGLSITIRLKQRAWLTLRNNLIPLKTPLFPTLFFTFPHCRVSPLHLLNFSPPPHLSAGLKQQSSADENFPSMSAVIPQTHTCCATNTEGTHSCTIVFVLGPCVCSFHSVSRAGCETRASSTCLSGDPKKNKVTRCRFPLHSWILGLKSYGINNLS